MRLKFFPFPIIKLATCGQKYMIKFIRTFLSVFWGGRAKKNERGTAVRWRARKNVIRIMHLSLEKKCVCVMNGPCSDFAITKKWWLGQWYHNCLRVYITHLFNFFKNYYSLLFIERHFGVTFEVNHHFCNRCSDLMWRKRHFLWQ